MDCNFFSFVISFSVANILADISKRLSEGEISQIEHAITKNMSEDKYFKMIANKTASLISASCYLGLYSNEKNEKLCQSVSKFGEYLGIAYQLKDDIFDILGNINNTGKSSHLDIKKNMMTLPYIHALSKLKKKEKRNFLIEIRKLAYRSDFQRIKDLIIKNEGIKYSKEKIKEFSVLAKQELENFPESIYKESLLYAIEFNISRDY